MKDCVIIDRNIPQYKGNFHMHTGRSWDSAISPEEALAVYRQKGYDFCAVTDHEVYWNTTELEGEDFLTLPAVESAFIPDEELPRWLLDRDHWGSLHINLLWDMTKGPCGFRHDQVLLRPRDYGLDSWNHYIQYCHDNNQLVIINHPNWSRLEPEIFLGIQGAFAFEIWNTGAVHGAGCTTDEALWDYCLSRGKRIWALTGDDTHKYEPELNRCGGAFTMVSADEFSREGLIRALKAGSFYPSNGPRIYDMRVVDNVLAMDFDPAASVRIISRDFKATAFTPPDGQTVDHIEWKVDERLKYFRVEIRDNRGKIAWSQPVFPGPWDRCRPALREDPHTPLPPEQRGWQ